MLEFRNRKGNLIRVEVNEIMPPDLQPIGHRLVDSKLSVVGWCLYNKDRCYVLLCDCGNNTVLRHDKLGTGQYKSCGCKSKNMHSAMFRKDKVR